MPVPMHAAPPQHDTPDHPSFERLRQPAAMEVGLAGATVSLAGLVGATPTLWIDDPLTQSGRGFWAKLEGHNPGGIKDRAGLFLVGRARQRGALAPGAAIVESTSGTLGLGLALAGLVSTATTSPWSPTTGSSRCCAACWPPTAPAWRS